MAEQPHSPTAARSVKEPVVTEPYTHVMPKRDTHYCYECDDHVTDDHEHDSVTYDPVVVPGKYGNGNPSDPKPYKSKLKRTASKIYRSRRSRRFQDILVCALAPFAVIALSGVALFALLGWLGSRDWDEDALPGTWRCMVDAYVVDVYAPEQSVNAGVVLGGYDFDVDYDDGDLWIYLDGREFMQIDPPRQLLAGIVDCAADDNKSAV